MTDLDATLHNLRDAVFNPAIKDVTPDELQTLLHLGAPMPGKVLVARECSALTGAVEEVQGCTLRLHPGMVYIFTADVDACSEMLDALEVERGKPQPYVGGDDILAALRYAIVSLRQVQLKLSGMHGVQQISFQAELQSSALALAELRRLARPEQAFQSWVDLVFLRHSEHLHNLRMRLIQLLSQLSATVDGQKPLGYLLQSHIRGILETYDLPALKTLMSRAMREIAEVVALQAGQPGSTHAGSPLVARALKYMGAHFTEAISLADVAAAAGASPEHLAREFRRQMNRTVVECLQTLRVNHARQLLAESNRTILDIAFSCGFESAEHFYRTFRKWAGSTPSAYRQANRQ